jgi:hypothetical protein
LKATTDRAYHLNKTIKAPIQFVFDWCTDFREDDYKLTDSTFRRTMYSRSGNRVVYVDEENLDGEVRRSKSEVTLIPTDRWILHNVGDELDEDGEYRLRELDANSTSLKMVFKVRHKLEPIPSRARWEKDGNEFWNKLIVALEKEYREKQKIDGSTLKLSSIRAASGRSSR